MIITIQCPTCGHENEYAPHNDVILCKNCGGTTKMNTMPDGDKGLTVNEMLIKDGRCWVSDEYADRLKKAFRAERGAAFKRARDIAFDVGGGLGEEIARLIKIEMNK